MTIITQEEAEKKYGKMPSLLMIFKPRSQESKPEDRSAPTPDMVEEAIATLDERITKRRKETKAKAKAKAAKTGTKKMPGKK